MATVRLALALARLALAAIDGRGSANDRAEMNRGRTKRRSCKSWSRSPGCQWGLGWSAQHEEGQSGASWGTHGATLTVNMVDSERRLFKWLWNRCKVRMISGPSGAEALLSLICMFLFTITFNLISKP